jgi:RNA polymerase sigma-70 factor, ECF subfamily
MHPDDFEIIESVRKGNTADYSLLIDRYKNKAFSMLCRMLKNELDAEEVLQDCFLKAYNGLNSFKGDSKFSTWFYRIVYNTAITVLSAKKRKIEKEITSIDEYYDLESDLDFNVTEKKNVSEVIREMIEKLPGNYAAVINLYYLEGMSCEEISEVMNKSLSNIKVILFRSRNALKDILIKNSYSEELL